MHFKPSIIAVFAALLTVSFAAPTPGTDESIGDTHKSYPGEEKRSDPAKDYVYPFKTYPEEEKRSDPAKDYIYQFKSYPEEEKRAPAQELKEAE